MTVLIIKCCVAKFFDRICGRFFGSYNDKLVCKYSDNVRIINELESKMKALSHEQMLAKTNELKAQYSNGIALNDILPEAFALVREAAVRIVGMRHYDVQLIGGMALHDGCISEMKTGEGKTLVATLPCYLNALTGNGVHVITVNDYLAKHGQQWMSRIYSFLGLTTGLVIGATAPEKRAEEYACDIVYATNTEVGFDYLRDNIRFYLEDMTITARGLNYAIVDEVDSILIDEARTPLIISGPIKMDCNLYVSVSRIVNNLSDEDFEIERRTNTIQLTDAGSHNIERKMKEAGILSENGTLYDADGYSLLNYINQSLRAHFLFHKDKDYIVSDDSVLLVDEFTGRIAEGRRYSEGLHQAIEAKEGVSIQNENQVLASITYQNFFRMYKKLSGMTGTAQTEAGEFMDIYRLKIVTIPTYRPIIRVDGDDLIFKTESEKFKQIADRVAECHKIGQPVLVGTTSIAKSEAISSILKKRAIKHNVLNAKYHEMEAKIIAEAGRKCAVTIATNMAGRGTDILLGGSLEFKIFDAIEGCDDVEKIQKITKSIHEEHEKERLDVIASGGLFVIGSERHESRRIDNQLRGRSGRLGDPGMSQFYLSLEDDLLRIFGGAKIDFVLSKLGFKDSDSINHPMLNRVIAKSQQKIENMHYEARKNVLKYDDIMNEQRNMIYLQRYELINSNEHNKVIFLLMQQVLKVSINRFDRANDGNGFIEKISEIFGRQVICACVQKYGSEWFQCLSINDVADRILSTASEIYALSAKMRSGDAAIMERRILITSLDECWKEHLYHIGHLREAIHLRAYAQKDPLTEYKIEAFDMFNAMLEKFHEMAVFRVMHMDLGT